MRFGKPARKASALRAVGALCLAAAVTGAIAAPAQADAPGHPGKHYLQVNVPSDVRTIGVAGGGVQQCFRVTPGAWNDTRALVSNGAQVEVWGYTVADCANRTTANQKYYDKAAAPSDSSTYFWFTLKNLRV
ncbi:hypothetical protein Sipo8835_41640 [Streptomyces ipomoeae]|uniref:Tat pathway signal sequence domain protein n=2 Tax=Streptomyces ipomoeae TaxID=103232 RepID=L1L127_9ACTN|nr:hypothetical protein [Streptomyces ipomoeae]AAO85559.1 ipomicin precursor [Streptomyces ipomoeae 91-03]EKX66766.1 hypothetical protein STRIP9103_03232 [Streptomyces ipomoeae 91-03]MDX2697100.1 hypothetical protein [Streptomyces ipomoeae]MDX2824621.1 hypothetical protein [Streptomyces ipomoeae]MDX2841858.1 hypothetical protein [Streptomyces ipomoeae]